MKSQETRKMEAFEGAGQSEGLEIWRIEELSPVKLAPEQHGRFHEGDSYIVMKTYAPKDGKMGIKADIHLWIGKNSSQDEYASAAILMVELDDLLGGYPIQHRECQDHEGHKFKSYFKNGLITLKGGVKSALTDVGAEEAVKRLYRLTGNKDLRFVQTAMNRSALTEDDVWILDGGKGGKIFIYCPKETTGHLKRYKAKTFANSIRDAEHAGSAEIEQIDELTDDFYDAMGPDEEAEESNTSSEDDSEASEKPELYHVSDESGEMQIEKIGEGSFEQDTLLDKDCFVLWSGGQNGVFAWIGKGATKDERKQAMESAQNLINQKGLPRWTKVTRVIGGAEPTSFKQYFSSWAEPDASQAAGWRGMQQLIAADIPESEQWQKDLEQANVNAESRKKVEKLGRSAGGALGFCPDDGSGKKEVYVVENMDLKPVDDSAGGKLFGGDSYVIKYTYEEGGIEKHIIYFWQGSESSQDERAVSALKAMEMDDALGGSPIQVRVVQGCEPRHFIKMFGGSLIIFSGGKASGFKNVHDNDTYDVDGTRLFRVRGTSDQDVRAVQVQPEKAASLDTDDVFILEHKTENLWVWVGEGASPFEREVAMKVAKELSPDMTVDIIEEGNEPEEFWSALGGKGDYSKIRRNAPILDPRLFHCQESPGTGRIRLLEVWDFVQEDLIVDDVMILDSGAELYVWIGKGANEDEVKKSMDLAKKYINSEPSSRNEENTLIFSIQQGSEPSSFASCFGAFNPWE